MAVADDFLEGRDDAPLLALPAPGDDQSELEGLSILDDTKSIGGASRFSGATVSKLSDRNFLQINKQAQGKMKPFTRFQKPTDRLAPDQRARLEEMVKEIEDNIEDLVKEREEYFKNDGT